MAFVEFENVGKTYHMGEVHINALHDASFQIKRIISSKVQSKNKRTAKHFSGTYLHCLIQYGLCGQNQPRSSPMPFIAADAAIGVT